MSEIGKKEYSARSYEGFSSSYMHTSAERLSDVVITTLTSYKFTWKTYPDKIEVTCRETK